ncbi:MAG: alpha/beta fold hydrolase [Mycobacteriales bacterium]
MPGQLRWEHAQVDGRAAVYGTAGEGPPVVFLHGWALAHRAYRKALGALVDQGLQVWAPALPGFGGTEELPDAQFSLGGYARWVIDFLDVVGVQKPVTLVGHSFGGGVAIRTAYDAPQRIARLVCVNSIGGSTWTEDRGVIRSLAQRPLWDWGLHLQTDLLPWRQFTRVLPVVLGDALPNLVRNPRALWRVGYLARTADLTAELEVLKQRRMPVVVLWGTEDHVLPAACLTSLRTALGDHQLITVEGGHSWLLSDPRAFSEVMTNVVGLDTLGTPGVA